MDYPFNLKGILYFPKINTEYESIEGTIKLYNNQVFIADNIKEVIPEFLMVLKGVIDCRICRLMYQEAPCKTMDSSIKLPITFLRKWRIS